MSSTYSRGGRGYDRHQSVSRRGNQSPSRHRSSSRRRSPLLPNPGNYRHSPNRQQAPQHSNFSSNKRSYGDLGDDPYLQHRKEQRQKIFETSFSILAPSPSREQSSTDTEAVAAASTSNVKKKSKKSKKGKNKKRRKQLSSDDSDDSDSSSDSEEEKKRKRRKDKKKKHKKEKSKKRSHHKKKKSRRSSSEDSSEEEEEEMVWEEKPVATVVPPEMKTPANYEPGDEFKRPFAVASVAAEENVIIGPMPTSLDSSDRSINFGHALLPGEGAAMAAYVADGKRIPRRGEIGLTSNEISMFEDKGYVMSGSRHRRMEAVRMRKENQIYSADEKRALASFNRCEREKKDARIINQFKELIQEKKGND